MPRCGVADERPAHGDDRSSATPLAAPGSVSGAASSRDPDWLVLDANTGGTSAIDVAAESDGDDSLKGEAFLEALRVF